jgi:hypothetical protein
MHFLKRFARNSTATILKLLLVFVATAAALIIPLSSPTGIKQDLAKNHLYDDVAAALIQENKSQYDSQNAQLDAASFVTAAKAAFTPQLLQGLTENFIDGTYHWLQGKTPVPDFKLDLSGAKQTFAASLAEQAKNRVAGLPTCTLAQLRTLDPNNLNPFSLPCRPPGMDINSQVQTITNQVLGDQSFLPSTFTVKDLPRNPAGQNAFEQADYVPTVYQLLKPALWILAVLSLISALLMIVLHDKRRSGVRQVGSTLLGTGIFLAISGLLYIYVFNHANPTGGNMAGIEPIILNATRAIFGKFSQILLIFSGAYAVVGIGLLIATRQNNAPAATAKLKR